MKNKPMSNFEKNTIKRLIKIMEPTHTIKFYIDAPGVFITNVANVIAQKNDYDTLEFVEVNDKLNSLYIQAEEIGDYTEFFKYVKSNGINVEIYRDEYSELQTKLNSRANMDLNIALKMATNEIPAVQVLEKKFGWINKEEVKKGTICSELEYFGLVKV